MLSLILFAIIGSIINATTLYWVIYGVYCVVWVIKSAIAFIKFLANMEDKL